MSTRELIVDGLGKVDSSPSAQSPQYMPYGGYGYTGEWEDDNELVYLRARYYSHSQGRFISPDPVEGSFIDPMSLNGYAYVRDNPVNFTDPSGYFPVVGGRRAANVLNSGACYQENNCNIILQLFGLCPTSTPTGTPSCSGTVLDECDLRYLAHISAAEAYGTGSNAAAAAVMLAQLNNYNRSGGNFYGFRVAELFIQAQFGLGEDQLSQTQSYHEYVSRCRANPSAFPMPDFEGFQSAYQMAQQMSCVHSPLQNFDYRSFSINAEDQRKLQVIAQTPTITQEKGFSASVLNYVDTWKSQGLNYLVPSWYPPSDQAMVFRGTGTQAVLIHDLSVPDDLPIHWQCPQSGGGITFAATQNPQRPLGQLACVQCDPGSIVWHNDPNTGQPVENYIKRCNVGGQPRGFSDDGTLITGS